jgi:uncharacterized damage-inducible protein DinB
VHAPIIAGAAAPDAPLAAAPLPFAASAAAPSAMRCYTGNMRNSIAIASLFVITVAFGRADSAPPKPPASVAQQLDKDLSWLERDLVPAAEAMPDSKYDFVPTQGEFHGVRTFAREVKHVAHTNFMFFTALLGEKPPADVDPKEEDGPETMRSKAAILKYLKDSFAMGHRAMSTLTAANLTQLVPSGKWTRLGAANLTIWHSYDHYGQMVEYLRMNAIVPPASRPTANDGAAASASSAAPSSSAGEYAKHFAALGKLSLAVASAMPRDGYAFRPHEESMTFGEVLSHIAITNYQFCAGFKDSAAPKLPVPTDREQVMQLLDSSFAYCTTVLASASAEQLDRAHDSPDGHLPGRDLLLAIFVHVAHHRGQAEIYLRDKGLKPPRYQF